MKSMKTFTGIIALACMLSACGQKANSKQVEMNNSQPSQEQQTSDKMDKQEFWRIIDYSANKSTGKEEVQMSVLREQLLKHSAEDILEYLKIQATLMNESNHYNAMYAYAIINGMPLCDATTDKFYVSEDGFLYFRLWLLHQGETMYTETLKNPDYLADKVKSSNEVAYEMIASVAMEAYFEKSGSEELPENYFNSITLDETVKGTRYHVKDLPGKFPKLWAKFMK